MRLRMRVWRQAAPDAAGGFVDYELDGLAPEFTLLEALDKLNDELVARGDDPVAFDSDCREGICGACGVTVDDRPHGPRARTPSCRQHVRSFSDGDTVVLEPLRSAAFPVVKDLAVDRSALDRVIAAGGTVAIDAGTAADADAHQLAHERAEHALDLAACIGCGACVAACPNGSASLFAGAKLMHLALLPSTRQERGRRARAAAEAVEAEFGPCSMYGECAQVCPAGIPLTAIAGLNRERLRAALRDRDD